MLSYPAPLFVQLEDEGLSADWQRRLTKSANRLPPALGGRHHVRTPPDDLLSLEEQRDYVGLLLRRWIGLYVEVSASGRSLGTPEGGG